MSDETPKRRLTDRDPAAAKALDPARIDQVEERVEEHVEDEGAHAQHEQARQAERREDQGAMHDAFQEAQEKHDHDFRTILDENRMLRQDVGALTTAVETLNTTLKGLVTKNQLQTTVETRLRRVERHTESLVDSRETKLRAEQRRAGTRQRALLRSQIASSMVIMILGMLLAVSVLDIHVHRAHIEPIEQRLDLIEALIAEVDMMVNDELPDLQTNPYPTSQLGPLTPAPQQTHAPAGWTLFLTGFIGFLLFSFEWRNARRELMATGTPLTNGEEPLPPPLGPLERRRAARNEPPRTEE